MKNKIKSKSEAKRRKIAEQKRKRNERARDRRRTRDSKAGQKMVSVFEMPGIKRAREREKREAKG